MFKCIPKFDRCRRDSLVLAVVPLLVWIVGCGHAAQQSGRFAPECGYTVSVSKVTVGEGGGDWFSQADYQVSVQRQDPSVLRQVSELEDRMDRLGETSAELSRTMAPLLEKRRLSELEPGPGLTEVERRRLVELERLVVVAEAGAEEYRELQALTEKRERSQLQRGQPLSHGDSAALERMLDSVSALEERISHAGNEHRALLESITGYTATVESDEKTVHFRLTPVLTVYPDDVLRVRVVDVDMFDNDVYGVHRFRVAGEMLRAGALELGPTPDGGVLALELEFRPAHSGAC